MSKTTVRGVLLTAALSAAAVQAPAAYAQAADTGGRFNAERIDGQTAVEKAIGRCVLAVTGGAVLGALLGGRRNAGRGALLGAGAGAGICVMMVSVASGQDKARLRQLQLDAVNSGQDQSQRWRTSDGKDVAATVSAGNVMQVASRTSGDVLKCRRANTHLDVNGQGSDSTDVVCLQGDSWVTLDKLKGVQQSDVT
jgi:hypothetical protein